MSEFRDEVRTWLGENLVGDFATLGVFELPHRRDRQ